MGISTGQRAAVHAWYQAGGHLKFWEAGAPTRGFYVNMPAVLNDARFEWEYQADSKEFVVVKNSGKFPPPAMLDFTQFVQHPHILRNPLDPTQAPLSEHLVCYEKSLPGSGGHFTTFVQAELARYASPVETYSSQQQADKKLNVASVRAPSAAAVAAVAGAAAPPAFSPRFDHHLHYKHSDKYQKHMAAMETQVAKPMVTRQQMTEVRGEFAAAKFAFLVLAKSTNDYHLKLGMNSPYVQGIDQIWVRRDPAGDVKEYVLVEAKGSRGAKLGPTASKGDQMSPQWAMKSLVELRDQVAQKKQAGVGFADVNVESLTTKIMKSMLGLAPDPRFPGHVPKVWGLIVHLQFSNPKPSWMVRIRDAGEFNVDN